MAAYAVEVDQGCQRGLHLRYRLAHELPGRAVEAARSAFDGALYAEEPLGPRQLQRLVLPFRFELRAGHADGELSFLLRFSSPEAQRGEDRAAVERLLSLLADPELS